ncbi:hypothetical protein BC937DRAFT_94702, partial [Endogone sp. FLAS-F59071]
MLRYNLLPTSESVSHFASRGLPKRTSLLLALGGGIIALFLMYSLGTRYSYNGLHRPQSYATASSSEELTCIANTANVDGQRTKWKWEQCLRPGSKPEYYLSVVLVTRNDDYAGGQYHRVQNHIDSTWLLAEKTKEKIELIIVEWNPPTDKRRIIDAYRSIELRVDGAFLSVLGFETKYVIAFRSRIRFRRSDYLVYRIITVPPSLHDIIYNRGDSPLHEFEGKNLGMRFARGEFIVCTNQDDIWSHLFFNAVKSRSFENGTIYLQHQDYHNMYASHPPSNCSLAIITPGHSLEITLPCPFPSLTFFFFFFFFSRPSPRHDNLPPSIVRVPAFADDETLFKACLPRDEEWGSYRPPEPIELAVENILKVGDQAGDFTMAHRDTWKAVRGYRESGGVA